MKLKPNFLLLFTFLFISSTAYGNMPISSAENETIVRKFVELDDYDAAIVKDFEKISILSVTILTMQLTASTDPFFDKRGVSILTQQVAKHREYLTASEVHEAAKVISQKLESSDPDTSASMLLNISVFKHEVIYKSLQALSTSNESKVRERATRALNGYSENDLLSLNISKGIQPGIEESKTAPVTRNSGEFVFSKDDLDGTAPRAFQWIPVGIGIFAVLLAAAIAVIVKLRGKRQ